MESSRRGGEFRARRRYKGGERACRDQGSLDHAGQALVNSCPRTTAPPPRRFF